MGEENGVRLGCREQSFSTPSVVGSGSVTLPPQSVPHCTRQE